MRLNWWRLSMFFYWPDVSHTCGSWESRFTPSSHTTSISTRKHIVAYIISQNRQSSFRQQDHFSLSDKARRHPHLDCDGLGLSLELWSRNGFEKWSLLHDLGRETWILDLWSKSMLLGERNIVHLVPRVGDDFLLVNIAVQNQGSFDTWDNIEQRFGSENRLFFHDHRKDKGFSILWSRSMVLGEKNSTHLVPHACDALLLVDIAVQSQGSPDT